MSPPYSRQTLTIPTPAWITAAFLSAAMFVLFNVLLLRHQPILLRFLFAVVIPLAAGGYALLVGYIYADARRRGMRYVMWTLLAIFLANGIGVILYFILRDPLPGYCSACGATMHPGYAFCPRCGANMLPACANCRRVSQPGWSHCAYCGTKL